MVAKKVVSNDGEISDNVSGEIPAEPWKQKRNPVNKENQRTVESYSVSFDQDERKIPFFDSEKTPDGFYIVRTISPSRGKNKGFRLKIRILYFL